MADEPARLINEADSGGSPLGHGLGEAVGARLSKREIASPCLEPSCESPRPGSSRERARGHWDDTIHFHPSADGASLGKASHRDFRLFATLVSKLEGGVFINLGSPA